MNRLVLLVTVLLSSACVRSPAVSRPVLDVDPPDTWSVTAEQDSAPSQPWWENYDAPQLRELIDLALARNHDLQAAAHRVEQVAAAARIARADLQPNIGAGLNAQRQRQGTPGFSALGGPGAPSVFFSTSESVAVNVETSWEADLWGRLRAGARAALADFQAAEADLHGARLSLSGQTAKLWFGIVEAQQQLDLVRATAEAFSKSSELVRARYESGVRPSIDLRLALSNQYGAEALIALTQNRLDSTLRRLETLLGRYPSATLLDQYEVGKLPDLPPTVPAGLPADLVSRRPDLVAAERRLAAAEQRELLARRARYPRLVLTARGGSVSDQLADLLDGDFSTWALIGNLTAPIFQGGRLKAGVAAAEAGGEAELADYGARVLRAYAEVETALSTEQRLRARETALRETAEQLEGARDLAQTRYTRGVGDYLTVLESQTRALSARIEWIQVRRELLTNRIDLHLALGGGFDARPRVRASSDEEPRS